VFGKGLEGAKVNMLEVSVCVMSQADVNCHTTSGLSALARINGSTKDTFEESGERGKRR
jgi:hypothetical protein